MGIQSIKNVDFESSFWMKKANDLVAIAKPLARFGITYFSRSRLFDCGIDDSLSTNPHAQEIFIDRQMWKHVFVGSVDSYSRCAIPWEEIDSKNIEIIEYLKEVRNSLGIANGIVLTEPKGEYVEFYYFGTTVSNYGIKNFYLNNLDILYNFIDYFNDVGCDIKRDSYDHRVYYPNAADKTILTSGEVSNTYHDKTNHDQTFLIMSDFYGLSKRERQCAQLLMLGNCCKRMASKMNLSTRTVEKHLQSLRRKTNSHNYSQMFTKLYNIKKTTMR